MNNNLNYLLLSVLILFSKQLLGMQTEVKNPVYDAVCAHNVAEVVDLFFSAPHISLRCMNIPDKNGQTALHRAVITNQSDTVKILLVNGADCNKKDIQNRTPLHHAVISGNTEIVKLLLYYRSSPYQRDLATHTPLYYANKFKLPEIVSLLLSYR